MNEKRQVRVSKFLSRVLRHAPGDAGLTPKPGGWVRVEDLLAGAASAGVAITRDKLAEVVRGSDKQRFAFDDTGTKIRANQGHSVEIDLGLDPSDPPAVLYHGTGHSTLDPILRDGLLKLSRHHVHLSPDTATAVKVGARHGRPVVFAVDAAGMRVAGHVFFRSANGVWLVEHVPPEYLRLLTPETAE